LIHSRSRSHRCLLSAAIQDTLDPVKAPVFYPLGTQGV
jgi:hypothetical protein